MSLSLKFFFSRSFSRDSVLFGKFRTVCETYNLEKVFQRTGYLLQPSKKNFCYFPHDANNILFCLNEQSRSYAKRAGFKKDKKDKKSQGSVQNINEGELLEVLDVDEMRHQMDNSLEHLSKQMDENLLLRPTLASIGSIIVETSDGNRHLKEIAQIQQKSASLILVNMADNPEMSASVKTAIINSAANVTPQVEGTTFYLPIQKVTREHREKVAKGAKSIADKAKEKLRRLQHKYERELKKNSERVSEDVIRHAKEAILQISKQYITKIDDLVEKKQAEILQKNI